MTSRVFTVHVTLHSLSVQGSVFVQVISWCVCVCVFQCVRDMREESSGSHDNSLMGEGKNMEICVLLTRNQFDTSFTPL